MILTDHKIKAYGQKLVPRKSFHLLKKGHASR